MYLYSFVIQYTPDGFVYRKMFYSSDFQCLKKEKIYFYYKIQETVIGKGYWSFRKTIFLA